MAIPVPRERARHHRESVSNGAAIGYAPCA